MKRSEVVELIRNAKAGSVTDEDCALVARALGVELEPDQAPPLPSSLASTQGRDTHGGAGWVECFMDAGFSMELMRHPNGPVDLKAIANEVVLAYNRRQLSLPRCDQAGKAAGLSRERVLEILARATDPGYPPQWVPRPELAELCEAWLCWPLTAPVERPAEATP